MATYVTWGSKGKRATSQVLICDSQLSLHGPLKEFYPMLTQSFSPCPASRVKCFSTSVSSPDRKQDWTPGTGQVDLWLGRSRYSTWWTGHAPWDYHICRSVGVVWEVNVGIYGIHGVYGIYITFNPFGGLGTPHDKNPMNSFCG